jgi:hypothetical protein
MAKTIAGIVLMNPKTASHSLVVRDSSNVKTLIASFPCKFATEMTTAEMDLTKRIAMNILVMVNSSSVPEMELFPDFVSHLIADVITIKIVLEEKMNWTVHQRIVQSIITNVTMTSVSPMFGCVTVTMIVVTIQVSPYKKHP